MASSRSKLLLDVNVLAIYLVEDHPGNRYVAPIVDEGLMGRYTPLMLDISPLRAYWIITKKWSCDAKDSERAVRHFLSSYPAVQLCEIGREAIQDAFEMAEAFHHDVFDMLYVAVALENHAAGIISTDTDFEKLCGSKKLEYRNPVPERVLKQFAKWQHAKTR